MQSINAQSVSPSKRNPRAFSFQIAPDEERRRDAIIRAAWMLIVAPFKCRPNPRGPWDETATGDLTPWAYPLALMRNAMAAAVANGDEERMNATLEGIRGFCHELEADIASMVPAREEESAVTIALAETHLEGPANEVEAVFIADPSPTNADRAVVPLERQADRLGKLIRKLRVHARTSKTPSLAGGLTR